MQNHHGTGSFFKKFESGVCGTALLVEEGSGLLSSSVGGYERSRGTVVVLTDWAVGGGSNVV